MGSLARGCGAGDCEAVTACDHRNAKLSLDPVEVLIACTVKERQQQIVVEFQLRTTFSKLAGRNWRNHIAKASATAPDKLLVLAAVIRTAAISPMRERGAAIWTLCK